MRKKTNQPAIPKKPSFIQEHKEFVEWWKEHIHSGFVEDNEGKWRWYISPLEAWWCARYRSEFTGKDEYCPVNAK